MIRIMPALLGLVAFAAPAAGEQRRFSVTDFDRVIVEGPYVVHLVVGRTSSATVTGSREAIDRVTVDSQGRMLRIRRNRNAWGGTPSADVGPVAIALEARSLRSARLIGPARLQVDGAEGLNVEFSVEGSGSLRATAVDAENLSLALIGSGDSTWPARPGGCAPASKARATSTRPACALRTQPSRRPPSAMSR